MSSEFPQKEVEKCLIKREERILSYDNFYRTRLNNLEQKCMDRTLRAIEQISFEQNKESMINQNFIEKCSLLIEQQIRVIGLYQQEQDVLLQLKRHIKEREENCENYMKTLDQKIDKKQNKKQKKQEKSQMKIDQSFDEESIHQKEEKRVKELEELDEPLDESSRKRRRTLKQDEDYEYFYPQNSRSRKKQI